MPDEPTATEEVPKPAAEPAGLKSKLLALGLPSWVVESIYQGPGYAALACVAYLALAGPPVRPEVNDDGVTVAYTSYFGLFPWYAESRTEALRLRRALEETDAAAVEGRMGALEAKQGADLAALDERLDALTADDAELHGMLAGIDRNLNTLLTLYGSRSSPSSESPDNP